MMFLTLVGAVLGIGFLIFVHELGHFLAAKACKVRVDTFAIGFQPSFGGKPLRIFSFRKGETEYVIGAIPFGGYVRMAGEETGDVKTGSEDEYASKSVSQRTLILVAGSTMNLIFGFLFFIAAYSIGVPFAGPKIGAVAPDSAAWNAGLQSGDTVQRIDGREMSGFLEISQAVATGGTDEPLEVVVDRDGQELAVSVTAKTDPKRGFPTLGIAPAQSRTVGAVSPGSSADEAGLEVGDSIRRVEFRTESMSFEIPATIPETLWISLVVEFAGSFPDGVVELTVDRDGKQVELEVPVRPESEGNPGTLGWRPRARTVESVQPGSDAENVLDVGNVIVRIGTRPVETVRTWTIVEAAPTGGLIELGLADGRTLQIDRDALIKWLVSGSLAMEAEAVVGEVTPESPATRMKLSGSDEPVSLQPGDEILAVNGEISRSFEDVRSELVGEAGPIRLRIRRGAEELELEGRTEVQPRGRLGFGVRRAEIIQQAGFPAAISLGVGQTKLWITRVFLTLRSLAAREVSPKNLSGPVGIISATQVFGSQGFAKYLWILALISVNLGVFNLLPFPILDGGHLMFLAIEKIKGSPVPDRIVHYAHLSAFVILIGFALFVTFYDIGRLFERLGLTSGG